MIIDKHLIISFNFSALITTMADGAGTLLLHDPVTQPNEYKQFEEKFRDACCTKGGGCDMYLATHPINDGSGYKPPKGCKCLRMPSWVALPRLLDAMQVKEPEIRITQLLMGKDLISWGEEILCALSYYPVQVGKFFSRCSLDSTSAHRGMEPHSTSL